MGIERGVSKSVKWYDTNPVLCLCWPGGALLGYFPIIVYNIGGLLLLYYGDVLIGEVILLFLAPLLLLLSNKTGKSGEDYR